jgi:serine/threonine-protein kinase
MGIVYRADDLKLGQTVALKFLPRSLAADPGRVETFLAEVRNAREVSHPNVCRVYDIGESDGQLFLTMEFVDGENLSSLLARIGHLPSEKAVQIAQQLAAGLWAAHSRGLVHRDLKPANIMIDGNGQAKITDFGLSIRPDAGEGRGEVAGTPLYMSPEQMAGSGATVRSDLYSLGLVLYETVSGRLPWRAKSLAEIREARETVPKPPSSFARDVEPALERIVLQCLEKDPAARPESALAISAALPGSDPLAAAMAAGETPSPAMVAAAGREGSLPRGVAWALFGSALLAILACALLAPNATLLGLAHPEKSPEVLAERAREIVELAGVSDPEADTAFWFYYDRDSVRGWASRPGRAATESSEAGLVHFEYRQSPQPLVSFNPLRPLSLSNPAFDLPGMVNVRLDSKRRLLSLEVVPPAAASPSSPPREPNWIPLLAAAGTDPTRLTSVEPAWFPPRAFDDRREWVEGAAEGSGEPRHLRAASLRGWPVFFEATRRPASPPLRFEGGRGRFQTVVTAGFTTFIWMLYAFGIVFARRNVRRGRGDVRGALAVGLVAAGTDLVQAALAMHPALRNPLDFHFWLRTNVAASFYFGTVIALLYLAAEPEARRYCPRLVISWSRLLAGRFRDPRVGSELLLGLALGGGSAALQLVLRTLPLGPLSPGRIPSATSLQPLLGATHYLADLLVVFTWSIIGTLVGLASLSIVTAISRRRWLGIALTAVAYLFALTVNASPWDPPFVRLATTSIGVAFVLLALVRFGAIAAAGCIFAGTLLFRMPLVVDPPGFYRGFSILTLTLAVGIAAFAFATSVGGRPLFGDPDGEE